MDRSGITNLLMTVSVNYPQFRRHIDDGHGGVSRIAIEEWHRNLGFLDYNEALTRLDNWMAGPDGSRIPKPMDLRNTKGARRDDTFHAPIEHQWHLEFMAWDENHKHGRLYDEEEREYVHDPRYEDGYHYDQNGRICTIDGRVVH